MSNLTTVLELIATGLGLVRQVKQAEGAERAFEELEKLTALMGVLKPNGLATFDEKKARAEIDRLVERFMRHEEITRGEREADAALANKFDTGKED